MLYALLKNQFIGVINLSIPVLILTYFYPWLLVNMYGIFTISAAMGIYLFYLNYKATKKQNSALLYKPSGVIKEKLENLIMSCGINPTTIELRYSYSHEGIALATLNTVSLDPLLWSIIQEDPEAEKAKQILETHIVTTLSDLQKTRLLKTREIFNSNVQSFIFKHELAHVIHKFSIKKLAIIGFIGFFATLLGINITHLLLGSLGKVAIGIALLIAGLVDLLLSYLSNVLFKLREENQADIFAAQMSNLQEIESAAEFFEKHQTILDECKEQTILSKIPSTILTGHPNGKVRATQLRNLMLKKSCNTNQ